MLVRLRQPSLVGSMQFLGVALLHCSVGHQRMVLAEITSLWRHLVGAATSCLVVRIAAAAPIPFAASSANIDPPSWFPSLTATRAVSVSMPHRAREDSRRPHKKGSQMDSLAHVCIRINRASFYGRIFVFDRVSVRNI